MKANAPASLIVITALAVAVSSCAAPPPPAPAPRPLPPAPIHVSAPLPPPTPADWRDAPATPGTWRWSMEGHLSVARYGDSLRGAVISLSCDPAAHVVTLIRPTPATAAASGPMPLTITATSQRRVLDAVPLLSDPPALQVDLRAADPLLDAMAFSRGRFMIEAPGTAPLYLPSWAEVSRVIEDCR